MIIGLETGHPCALQSEAPQTDDGFLSNYAKTFHSKGPTVKETIHVYAAWKVRSVGWSRSRMNSSTRPSPPLQGRGRIPESNM